jgi:hypothetical protein
MASDYLGFRDLVARWNYTRQGVYNLLARADFPAPAFAINEGTIKVWRVADIATFESDKPELLSVAAKLRKVRGYCIAVGKGGQQ